MLAAAGVLAVLGGVSGGPAAAGCHRVDLWVTWSPDSHKQYVTPWAPRTCSPVPVPAGWDELTHPAGSTGVGFMPAGLPNGVGYDGSVQAP